MHRSSNVTQQLVFSFPHCLPDFYHIKAQIRMPQCDMTLRHDLIFVQHKVASKKRLCDATAVLTGLKFADNIHY